jgi:ribonuclease HI
VAGSSALRAAILRQTRLEIASSQGFAWGQVLWDIEKFYDHVQLQQVAEVAMSDGVDYPLIPLALGLSMHMAPRRVSTDGVISERFWPTRSLIAGCGQSIDFGRLALWRVLEKIHLEYLPKQLETWVDDLHHLERGRAAHVEAQMLHVSAGLADELQKNGFKLSAKSAIITSPPKIAGRVATALRARGIHVQAPTGAKDLGVTTHGVRRSTLVIRGRLRKAARRALAIRRLMKVDKRARALVNTGYRPQAIWGQEGQGLAPTTLRYLRGTIANMTGCKRPGGCSTTSIRMSFGMDADPHILCRRQLFDNWLYILDTLEDETQALQLAWKKMATVLTRAKSRWQRLRGTMATVIATLLDLQWRPMQADIWQDSDGEEFNLRRCDRARLLDFALKGAAEEAVWKKASRGHLGRGLAGGVDLTSLRRHLRQLRSRGDPSRAAVLEMVAGAALWPAARRLGVDDLDGLHLPEAQNAASPCPASAPATAPTAPARIENQREFEQSADVVEAPAGAGNRQACGARPDGQIDDQAEFHEEARTEDGGPSLAWFSQRPDSPSQATCPRCRGAPETTFHQLWSCPCNSEVTDARPDLLEQARLEHQECPGFWLRGLVPLEWTYQYCMTEVTAELHFHGCRPSQPIPLPEGAVIGTDGSGGSYSADPRIRRCGWAFVVIGSDHTTVASGWGPLLCWRQTVPLAELDAARVALLCTTGPVTLLIDNATIVRGIRRGPMHRHTANAHQWRSFWEAAGDRDVTVIKIKSHQRAQEAEEAGVPTQHWIANQRADQLAEQAAQEAQLPEDHLAAIRSVDALARAVQEHLAAVAQAVAQDARGLYGPSSRHQRAADARLRAAARAERLETILATTAHTWCQRRRRCLACHRAPTKAVPREVFLQTPCSGRPGGIHSTHRLRRHRGLWYCSVCGSSGARRFTSRGLGGPCHPPSASGLRTLTRLQAGLPPYHRRSWPDEEAEEAFGLELVS